jgi:hypothetical protein
MYIVRQGGRVDYDYKEVYLDEESELASVDTKSMSTGSVAYVIKTGTVYILNSQKEWIAQ